jgi:hypothetical protein
LRGKHHCQEHNHDVSSTKRRKPIGTRTRGTREHIRISSHTWSSGVHSSSRHDTQGVVLPGVHMKARQKRCFRHTAWNALPCGDQARSTPICCMRSQATIATKPYLGRFCALPSILCSTVNARSQPQTGRGDVMPVCSRFSDREHQVPGWRSYNPKRFQINASRYQVLLSRFIPSIIRSCLTPGMLKGSARVHQNLGSSFSVAITTDVT